MKLHKKEIKKILSIFELDAKEIIELKNMTYYLSMGDNAHAEFATRLFNLIDTGGSDEDSRA